MVPVRPEQTHVLQPRAYRQRRFPAIRINVYPRSPVLRDSQRSFGFIAIDDERAIGILLLTEGVAIFAGGVFGQITELYVDRKHRSRGIASLLVRRAAEFRRQFGWRRMDLGAPHQPHLGYSLLTLPGATLEDIREVIAHPVAPEEVKPWLDKKMPTVRRITALGGGAAAKSVSESVSLDKASMGPKIGGSIYGLVSLVDNIEEGPHNVTRWWVLGREMPAPTGNDKTSLLADVEDNDFSSLLADMTAAGLKILAIYERPSKRTLDTHRYLIEVAGHAKVGALNAFLGSNAHVRVLGSYARQY